MAKSTKPIAGGIGITPPSPCARLIDTDTESDVFDVQSDGENRSRPFSLFNIGHFVNGRLRRGFTPHEGSPFQSLEHLFQRPAYLSIFLRHLFDTKGCEGTIPVLFLLRVASYYHFSSGLEDSKDAKRQGQSIINAFLSSVSPWETSLDTSEVEELETILKDPGLTVENASCIFNSQVEKSAQELDAELRQYAGSLKAEDDDETLQEDIARLSECEVAQKILCSIIPASNSSAKDCAYAVALTSLALTLGLDQKSSFLDRLGSVHHNRSPSIAGKSLFVRGKGKRQVHFIAGHSFVATHYNSPTFCDYCNGLLWGLGNQGYTCQQCNYNVHKQTCNRSITEHCRGEPREGGGSLFRRGSLKPSFSGSFRQGIRNSASRSSLDIDATESGGETSAAGHIAGISRRKLATVAASSVQSDSSCDSSVVGGDWLHGAICDINNHPSPISLSSLRRGSTDYGAGDANFTSQKPIARAQSMKACPSPTSKSRARSRESLSGFSTTSMSTSSRRSHDYSTIDGTPLLSLVRRKESANMDPDMLVDEDLIPWSSRATEECLASLDRQEVKRQDLINELIHTEKTHVKKLKVLLRVFRAPLLDAEALQKKMVLALFPGLDELVEFHVAVMRRLCDRIERGDHCRVDEVGDVIADVFSLGKSEAMREAAAEWVKLRQANLDYIKSQAAKNPSLASLLQQCEANPLCQRLKLADLTSVVMQRFTKYPLLLEGILKVTDKEARPDDHANLSRAIDLSRTVLAYINHEVMQFENNCSLTELQSRLDMKNMDKLFGPLARYRNLDISNRDLLHRSDLKWKQKGKLVPVDALLFGDILLLLEHNEDKTRHTLRFREDHVPILTLKDLLPPREVASDREHKSFLLVWLSSAGSRMVELSAPTSDASATWRVKLADAIAAAKFGEAGIASDAYQRNIKAYLMRSTTSSSVSSMHLASDRSESTNTSLTEELDDEDDNFDYPHSAVGSAAGSYIEPDIICSPLEIPPEDVFTTVTPIHRLPEAQRSPYTRRQDHDDDDYRTNEEAGRLYGAVSSSSSSADLLSLLRNCIAQSEKLVSMAGSMVKESRIVVRTGSGPKESKAAKLAKAAELLHADLIQSMEAAKAQKCSIRLCDVRPPLEEPVSDDDCQDRVGNDAKAIPKPVGPMSLDGTGSLFSQTAGKLHQSADDRPRAWSDSQSMTNARATALANIKNYAMNRVPRLSVTNSSPGLVYSPASGMRNNSLSSSVKEEESPPDETPSTVSSDCHATDD